MPSSRGLTERRLDYFVSRKLASHVGPGERFAHDGEHAAFDAGLAVHCREAARIVEALTGGWYGKKVCQRDGLPPAAVGRFAPFAFEKIRAELRKRRNAAA